MISFRVLFSLLLPLLTGIANAQQAGNQPASSRQTQNQAQMQPRILRIDAQNAAAVTTLANRNDVDAVSLALSDAELQAQPGGMTALQNWVNAGGIAFLHTDAAQRFEYTTVAARLPTAQTAGQLFGRAVAALPFGAHPLLLESVRLPNTTTPTAAARNAIASSGDEEPGVQVVYYQMNEGDHLVVQHPSAVPLLRVTDLAVAQDASLYAVAMAPYGQGWTVFLPNFINPDRADGALFIENLMQWVNGISRAPRGNQPATAGTTSATAPNAATSVQWFSLPAAFIESASDAASRAAQFDAAATLQELYKVSQTPAAQSTPTTTLPPVPNQNEGINGVAGNEATPNPPRVLLTREEVAALAAQLNAGSSLTGTPPNGAPENQAAATGAAQIRAVAMLYLLRARLEYQRGQTETATAWVQAAEAVLPNVAETELWKGMLTAGNAQNITLSSQVKAQLLGDAIEFWRAALSAPTISGASAGTQPAQNRMLGNVPLTTVQLWITAAGRRVRLLQAEPPLVTLLGTTANPVVLRHFPDDPTLRLALPAGDMLPRASQAAGWRVDSEEILIFPTPQYYQTYRAAAGLRAPLIDDPSGGGGDVVGNRILMVSQPALPVILPPQTPGGAPRTVQFGTGVPVIISRLHAYILMNQLVQDGNPPPAWMQIGLVTLSNLSVVTNVGLEGVDVEAMRRFAAANGLLLPEQFRAALAQAVPGSAVEAQAARMLAYFYGTFGTGAVVETLQRLGEGQDVDEAMAATTGLTEEEFFLAWRDAEFGVQ